MSIKAIQEKSVVVSDIKDKVKKASSVTLVEYQGLTVAQVTELRNKFRAKGIEYRVLKNRMILRAFTELGYKGFDKDLQGPTAVIFGSADIAAPAKILNEVMKELKPLKVKSGLMEGAYLTAEEVAALAMLPSKEVLIAKMLGSMQSPITKLVCVLNATVASLPRAIQAIADKKAQ